MHDGQVSPASSTEAVGAHDPARALIVRPMNAPAASLARVRRLPARLAAQLPVLWQGGRGPLAQAAMAGGLLALGTVVGRLRAGSSSALVPTRPGVASPSAPSPSARRHIVRHVTEIGTTVQRTDGSARGWHWRRARVVEEWQEEE